MIRRLGPDTIVTVLERDGRWWLIELDDGTRGWAFLGIDNAVPGRSAVSPKILGTVPAEPLAIRR